MPGFTGDFDHFGVDVPGNRLFLAAEVARTVEVFDLKNGTRINTIRGFGHPLMMQYLPGPDQLLVTDGGFPEGTPGSVRIVDCKSYTIAATVTLPPNVDHGAYNPIDHCYYVESGPESAAENHLLNVVDVGRRERIASIVLPGESNEGMVVNHAGNKLYVNLTGPNEVGVVDLARRSVEARWPLPGDAKVAHAIALDETDGRLFTVSRKPGRFIVMELGTGHILSEQPCVGVNSDISRDLKRNRIYISGTDTVSVFEQQGPDTFVHLAEVPSAFRAKSSVFVPELNQLYVAASGKGKPDAKLKLMIFKAE